jgi:amino acid adenylation domain-containing protein
MKTADFLSHLRTLDIVISAEGDQLQVSAPKRALTPELREQLAIRKPEILEFLNDSYPLNRSEFETIERISRQGDLPLSFAQTRLWFLEQMAPGTAAYTVPMAWRLSGNLDFSILERSLSEIVRRHEVLRTVLPAANGLPKQVILPVSPDVVQFSDLTSLVMEERGREAERLMAAAAESSFDLTKGPLFRAELLRINMGEHVLLLTAHHSVIDAWSMGVFWREFSSLYCALRAGKSSPLPELPVQYADFAAWQRKRLEGPEGAYHLAFWKKQLDGCQQSLELPADGPRITMRAQQSGRKTLHTTQAVCDALNSLSRREGVSLFMVLLAAFNVLLYRLSGQDDILVGTPIAGRDRAEFEAMIGFFINTVVIRTRMKGEASFRDLLGEVRDTVLNAYSHQDMPFEELVDALNVKRDLGQSPLFQVFFNHLNFPAVETQIPGIKAESFWTSESKFDLTLYSGEQGGSIHLLLLYNAEKFDERRMEIMLDQYSALLDQICVNQLRPLDSYSLLTASSSQSVPDPTQRLASHWPGSVHAKFLQEASHAPEKIAVIMGNTQWSYGQLETVSRISAARLRRQGVGSGDIVAVYGQRGPAFVAALLGVLQAGAAFCILDPAYPAARLINSLRAANPKAWLQIAPDSNLSNSLEMAVDETVGNCRVFISDVDGNVSGSDFAASATVDPDSPAYLTFTSGTTGDPKCILNSHRPLSHFIDWHVRKFELGATDRFSMLSGLAHDPLLRDIFTPLWLGATLCIPSLDDIFLPGRLSSWMKEQKITVTHLTPAIASLVTRQGKGEDGEESLPALRYVFFGGDVLSFRDVALVTKAAPHASCVNFYGATETPQAVAWYPINPIEPPEQDDLSVSQGKPVPIGGPISDTQLLILNRYGTLSGPGELGEIHVRSQYLSHGYVNDKVLTHERFVRNPYTADSNDRLYRTGDLARYTPDGVVEFAGRADRQIKIRGYRIEPGEIEAVLNSHPNIQDCAIVASEAQYGNKKLVAFAIARNRLQFSPGELRTYLRKLLPEYMIPVEFVALDALPLTPNGKVDHRELLRAEEARLQPTKKFVPPRNQIELLMTEIWSDVLNVAKVGVTDDFFELGGHSLSATRLVSRLQSGFGIDLPLRCLFIEPTVAGLSKYIRYDAVAQTYQFVGEAPRWKCLVPGQQGGKNLPLFLVMGYQGPDDTLISLSRLVPHMGPDQPVYGLRPRWIEGDREGYSSVEEAAHEHIAEIRSVQPNGPYLLGGYCVGGILAFEMAQQLLSEGEEVWLLALIDTEQPTAANELRAGLRVVRGRTRNLQRYISRVIRSNGRSRRIAVRDFLSRKFRRFQRKKAEGFGPDDLYSFKMAYRALMYSHRPKRYPGRIALIVNEHIYNSAKERAWDAGSADGFDIYKTSGGHSTLLTQHGRELAEVLLKCIDDALSRHVRSSDNLEDNVA